MNIKKTSSQDSTRASKKPLAELKNISLSLDSGAGQVDILKDVSLNIKKGETIAIVGPSGSGKTTLLMVLSGLQLPTDGAVQISGAPITEMDEDALATFRRDNIGIVFQNFHLIPTMTALENVATPLEFASRKDAFKQAEKTLKAVGLGHRLNHYPGQMSGGEQQRVALARALVVKPKLLLADEPTGNLDSETGEKIIQQLFGLAKSAGTTLVLVTHDKTLAARCARQVTMADGVLHA